MTRSDRSTTKRHGNLAIVLLLVTGVQALATLSVLSLATLAPAVSISYGIDAHYVGYQVSLIYVSASLVSLVAGTLVVRQGAIATSQLAMTLCGVGVLGMTAGNLIMLLAGSLMIGAGYGLTNPAASHLLFRLAPPGHRNLLFSLKQTSVPIGGVIAGLLLPALTSIAGWRPALAVCTALLATVFLVLMPYRKELDADRRPASPLLGNIRSGMVLLIRRKSLLRLSIMAFCFSATQLSLMSFAVSMLVQDLAKTLVIAGGVASLMQGCGAFGRIFWGMLADRFTTGIPVLLIVGVLSMIASLAMITVSAGWPFIAVVALLCLYGTCSIGWNGVFLAEVARISRSGDVGSMTGMVLFFTFGGVVVGPTIFATAYHLLGTYTATFGVMAIFPAIGTLSILRFKECDSDVSPAIARDGSTKQQIEDPVDQ